MLSKVNGAWIGRGEGATQGDSAAVFHRILPQRGHFDLGEGPFWCFIFSIRASVASMAFDFLASWLLGFWLVGFWLSLGPLVPRDPLSLFPCFPGLTILVSTRSPCLPLCCMCRLASFLTLRFCGFWLLVASVASVAFGWSLVAGWFGCWLAFVVLVDFVGL